jgi:hypothetical protein
MEDERLFNTLAVVAVIASLAVTGVIIWAIIMLVNHFAGAS